MTELNRRPSRTPFASRVGELLLDVVGLGGAGLITYGAHLVYHPAGFIVGGAFLLGGVWLVARKNG